MPWAAGDIALWLAAIVVFGIIFAKHYAIAIVVGAAGIPVVAASSHLIWRSRTERFGCGCDAATAVRHWARTNAVGAAFFGILCVYPRPRPEISGPSRRIPFRPSPPPRNIHVVAAAPPRPASTEDLRGITRRPRRYFIAVAFIKGANRSHHASFVTKLVLAGAAALAAAYSWRAAARTRRDDPATATRRRRRGRGAARPEIRRDDAAAAARLVRGRLDAAAATRLVQGRLRGNAARPRPRGTGPRRRLARRRGLEEIDVLLAIAQAREVRFSPDDGRLVSKDYTKSKSDEGI